MIPFLPSLSNNDTILLREIILGDLQVQRRGPLPRPARDVVVGAVAGAEPASEIAGFADGDAAEVCADACLYVRVNLPGAL